MFKKLFAITALSALTAATLNASEPGADDKINDQPHHVLTHVFMHAVTGDNPQNPVDLMLVCKNWHRVINGDSFKNKYNKKTEFFLDLTQHTKESAEKWVDNELLSRGHLIQHVHIEGRTPGNIFASLLPRDLFPSKFMECRNLTSLKIRNNERTEKYRRCLPGFVIDPFAGYDETMTRLKKEFKLIENLKVLELEDILGTGRNLDRFLIWVIPNLNNLEKLAINPFQDSVPVPLMNWRDMPALKEIVLNSPIVEDDGNFETPKYIFNKVNGQWVQSNGPADNLGTRALNMLTNRAILPRE